MAQRRFAVLRADIGRELVNVRRLVAEAEEWQTQLYDWPEAVRLRTAGGILHDFYCGLERLEQQLGAFDEFLYTLEREV